MTDARPDELAIRHLRAELDKLRTLLEARVPALVQAGVQPPVEVMRLDTARAIGAAHASDLPLARLQRAFALSEEEFQVLLLSLAADFDPTLSRLFATVHGQPERAFATFQLLTNALRLGIESASLRWILDPESTLVANALLRIDGDTSYVPMTHRPLVADPRIVRYVQGFAGLDEKLGGVALLEPGLDVDGQSLTLTPKDDATLRAIVRQAADPAARSELPLYFLRGPEGVGKHTWSRTIAGALCKKHLRVDLGALVAEYGHLEHGLRIALREARLQGAMLCLDGWARLVEPGAGEDFPSLRDQAARLEASRVIARVLRHVQFTMTTDDPHIELPTLPRPVKVLSLEMPDLNTSIALWKQYLPRDRPKGPGLTNKRIAQSFRLTPGHIQLALAQATTDLPADAPLTYEGLTAAIKLQLRHRLGENASLVTTDYVWADLVVPPDVDLQMRELIGRWRSKSLVFETWGLGRRFATGQGLSVLFEGPPGTGKTMAASIVAKELDLDVYRIDLSKIMNRYGGETEKNLGRIFDEAERSRVMLLFDEADSLFANRTEVKSANDRHANMQVNYLLQRVENFAGIAILTTNFPTALDQAFRRRIAMRVTFPKPQLAERQRLWDSMLTNRAILAPKLDTEDLAYEFELAGGHIKNAVLRAAFIAATRGCLIDQDLLRIAARIELKEQGLLVHGSPYDELRARE